MYVFTMNLLVSSDLSQPLEKIWISIGVFTASIMVNTKGRAEVLKCIHLPDRYSLPELQCFYPEN